MALKDIERYIKYRDILNDLNKEYYPNYQIIFTNEAKKVLHRNIASSIKEYVESQLEQTFIYLFIYLFVYLFIYSSVY